MEHIGGIFVTQIFHSRNLVAVTVLLFLEDEAVPFCYFTNSHHEDQIKHIG